MEEIALCAVLLIGFDDLVFEALVGGGIFEIALAHSKCDRETISKGSDRPGAPQIS